MGLDRRLTSRSYRINRRRRALSRPHGARRPSISTESAHYTMGNSSLTRLFRRAAPALAIAAMLALAAYADAAAGPRPGLWKVTTRVSREGVTSEPNSQSSCVTADQMKDPSRSLMPPQSPDEKCTRTQYEWTGSKLTWRIQCNGRMATSGGGDIDFDTPGALPRQDHLVRIGQRPRLRIDYPARGRTRRRLHPSSECPSGGLKWTSKSLLGEAAQDAESLRREVGHGRCAP